MNTPAHAVLNLLVLGRHQTRQLQLAVLIGALLPDLPMLLFYFIAKVFLGIAESRIWGELYHQEIWQIFFAVFNSIPLIGLGLIISVRLPSPAGRMLFLSMMLHVLFDLPLHNADAHRHFFPLSDWRYHSPVSYWDPNHFGSIITAMEISLVIIGSIDLWRKYPTVFVKSVLVLIGGAYVGYLGYATWTWS